MQEKQLFKQADLHLSLSTQTKLKINLSKQDYLHEDNEQIQTWLELHDSNDQDWIQERLLFYTFVFSLLFP